MILPETVTNYPDLFNIMEAKIIRGGRAVNLILSEDEFYDLQRILDNIAGVGAGTVSVSDTCFSDIVKVTAFIYRDDVERMRTECAHLVDENGMLMRR